MGNVGKPGRRAILRDPDLAAKIVFGSDFPAQAFPLCYLYPFRTPAELALRRVRNPFDNEACWCTPQ